MTNIQQALTKRRDRRIRTIRAVVHGTATRPRLSVERTALHFRAQLIDDTQGKTLASASDAVVDAKLRGVEQAKAVGKLLAEKAVAASITSVVFDRRGYTYHGRVAAFADAARAHGLQF
ncbi:MAG: 50S ribosomal protein L18 [Patescibacteria group bacterium]